MNADKTLLPGITLGGLTIDSCDNEQHALEQTMELIQVTFSLTIRLIATQCMLKQLILLLVHFLQQ